MDGSLVGAFVDAAANAVGVDWAITSAVSGSSAPVVSGSAARFSARV